MLRKALLLLPCFALTWQHAVAQSSSSNSTAPTATIANGTVVGTTTSLPAATAPVNKFLGIPFAQSPPQRFSPAQPAEAFNGTFMATSYSPACVQQFPYPQVVQNVTEGIFNTPPPPAGESEDCLYLNIFAPSTPPPADGRAILFWLFGGAFEFGTGTLAAYDGSAFAAYNDVIVVTFNYRTNVFGFPGSSDLPLTERNVGFLDQRMALQWVQDNIKAFGGDPSKVTIFGESAGAFSVDSLVTSFNTSNAPFRAAIMESGQVSYPFFSSSSPSTDNDIPFQQLAQLVNCTTDVLTCLRSIPATTIKAVIEQNSITFGVVTDNYTFVQDKAARRADGRYAQVPTLIGSNANEGRIFELGQSNLTQYIQTTFGAVDPSAIFNITQAFPTNETLSAYDQISEIFTLIIFQCGSKYLADQNSLQDVPTWRYLFNASFPNLSPFGGLLRVYHSAEIPLVFNSFAGGPVNPVSPVNDTLLPIYLPSTPQQNALGQYMNAAWANFAKNPQLGPGWGKTDAQGDTNLVGVLGGTSGLVAGVELVNSSVIDAQCEVFMPLFEKAAGVPLS